MHDITFPTLLGSLVKRQFLASQFKDKSYLSYYPLCFCLVCTRSFYNLTINYLYACICRFFVKKRLDTVLKFLSSD